jgi:hypothetical protein
MNHLTESLLFFLASIFVFAISTYIISKRDTYSDRKTESDCEKDFSTLKDGDHCGAWDKKTCYKGTKNGTTCKKGVDYIGMALLILGVILFFVALFKLFMR